MNSKTLYDTVALKTSIDLSQSDQDHEKFKSNLNFQNKSNPNLPIIKINSRY